MKIKMGVIGSGANLREEVRVKAYEIGKEIAIADCILITGSGQGLPYEAVKGAKEIGGITIGISPASNIQEQVERYKFPTESFDVLIFTGFGLKGRNVPFIRTCDGIIVISGRIGTLNEFTIAYDERKVIGVLKGTGGISESIEDVIKGSEKEGGKVIYESDPHILIKEVIRSLRSNVRF